MKQGTLVNRIVMLVLFFAVVVYIGVYAWQSLSDPFSTTLSYAYTMDDAIEATGFLVREETVLSGQPGIVDLLPQEGEKVARGEAVAVLYQNSSALDRKQALRALELEREQLQYALQRTDGTGDTAQLSQQVLDAIVTLRASVAAGDLTSLENETMDLKSLVYKRDFTYGDGTGTSIEDSIKAVDAQIAALNAQAAQDTSRVTVDRSGTFSGLVDGYEGLLTPAQLASYTPSSLDALANQKPAAADGALGKLITSATWYFVCPLTEAEAGRLVEGRSVKVRFSRDWSGEVDMLVERIGAPENGRVAVVLSTDRYLSDTTLLRRQTVDLIFESKSGIRVPKAAVRVDTRVTTDPETQEEIRESITGVYAVVGAQAEFKPVEVLDQGEDFCLVSAAAPRNSEEAKKILRAGDEIIVTATGLFDGKVVR